MEFRILRPNPANVGGSRPLSAIKMVIVHCTEGQTAAGAAGWWARPYVKPGTNGSAHVVSDDEVTYRAVDDDQVAYGARGYNYNGFHIEICGFANREPGGKVWTRDVWLEHPERLEQAATFHAAANLRYGIPLVESLTNGYHSHRGLPGNDHGDPGLNFPWDHYLARVRAHMVGQVSTPKPAPLEGGNTLRVILRVPGADEPYVSVAGWPASLPVMRALADRGIKKPGKVEITFTWQKGVWRAGGQWGGDPREVLPVIRTVLNHHGPKE